MIDRNRRTVGLVTWSNFIITLNARMNAHFDQFVFVL